jgi:hypothetical protein
MERALLCSGSGSQGIALCGRCETLHPFIESHLSLLEHMHELDTDQRALSGLKRLESEHGAGDPFDAAIVLLHHMIQIFHPGDDGGPVLLIVAPEGRGIGLTAIDGDLLGHPVAADRLGEEAHGGPLIALGCQQEINGLASLIYRLIQIVPLAFPVHRRNFVL